MQFVLAALELGELGFERGAEAGIGDRVDEPAETALDVDELAPRCRKIVDGRL